MKYLFTIFLIITNSIYSIHRSIDEIWNAFNSKKENAQIIQLALSTRLDKFEDGLSEEDDRLLHMVNLLQDYSCSERNFFDLFLEKELQLQLPDIFIKEFRRNLTHPDRTLIYFIYNSERELIAVVKAFHEKYLFAKELSSLEKLYMLNLKLSTTVTPLGIGKAKKGDEWLYLVAESPAQGKTITKLVQNVIIEFGPAKEQTFLELKIALQRHAEALKELHIKSLDEGFQVVPDANQFYKFMVPCEKCIQKCLKKNHINLDLNKLAKFYRDLKDSVIFYYPSKVYAHGDLNWCNIFYDAIEDQITYIDTITMHHSINSKNQANASFYHALRDYQTAFGRMELFRSRLSTQKKQEIEDIYSSNYTPLLVESENKEILQIFWKVVHMQGRIDYNIKYLEENPKYTRKDIKRLEKNVRHLKRLRKDFYELKHLPFEDDTTDD